MRRRPAEETSFVTSLLSSNWRFLKRAALTAKAAPSANRITTLRTRNFKFIPPQHPNLKGNRSRPLAEFGHALSIRAFSSFEGISMSQRAAWCAVFFGLGAAPVLWSNPVVSAEAPLNTLNGTWGGDGSLSFDDGPAEKLTCLGYYKSPTDGKNLSIVIRCYGDPDKLELRAKLKL